jgi:hypothetical protein
MPSVTKRPGTASDSGPGAPWSNIPYSIDNSTTTAATSVVGSGFYGSCTRSLLFSSIGFSIPENATITGVGFLISFAKSGSASVTLSAYLLNGSTRISDQKSTSTTTSSQTTYQFGGNGDLWGASLSPSLVNSSSFGVEFIACCTTSSENVSLYDAQVEIHYTIPVRTESSLVQASETRLLTVKLYPTDSPLLTGNEQSRLTLTRSDPILLSSQDLGILYRAVSESLLLRFEEGSGLRADLSRGESASLLSLEAQGLALRSGEVNTFVGVEEILLRALLSGNDSSLLAGGEALGLSASRTVSDLSPLSALEAQGLVFRSGEADALFVVEGILLQALLSGNESSLLTGGEARNLSASRTVSDPSPLSALEALGLALRSGEVNTFFGVEGILLRALLSGNESPLLTGGEARNLSTSRTVSDSPLLSSLDLATLRALLSSLETRLVRGEGEGAKVLLPVSDRFSVLGDEDAWIELLLADLLSIPATDLVLYLIQILEPRASISIERPRATIMVWEEGGRLVERIYRGTETAVVLRFSSSVGRYYDPLSVQFLVRRPSGAVSSLSVQRIGPGTYRAELLFDEPGIWVLRAEGTEPLRAVTEKRIEVIGDL